MIALLILLPIVTFALGYLAAVGRTDRLLASMSRPELNALAKRVSKRRKP